MKGMNAIQKQVCQPAQENENYDNTDQFNAKNDSNLSFQYQRAQVLHRNLTNSTKQRC